MQACRICRAQTSDHRNRFRGSAPGTARQGWLGFLLAFATLLSTSTAARADDLIPWRGPLPPAFPIAAIDGEAPRLSAFAGKVVLVHFFATWCEPCRPELEALERLRLSIGDDLEILAISVAEPDERVRRHFAAHPVGFRVLLDRDRAVARAWGVHTLPSSFLLDRSLTPLGRADGDVAWDDAIARSRISEALASPAAGPAAER